MPEGQGVSNEHSQQQPNAPLGDRGDPPRRPCHAIRQPSPGWPSRAPLLLGRHSSHQRRRRRDCRDGRRGAGLARAPLRFEAARAIEYARRTALLTATGSVCKQGPLSLSRPSGHAPRRRAHCSIGRAGELPRGGGGLPLVRFAEVPLDDAALGQHRVRDVCDLYIQIAPERQGRSLPVWTEAVL